MTTPQRLAGIVLMSAIAWPASAQAPSGNGVPVTVDNFIRAETDLYFSAVASKKTALASSSTTANYRPIDAQTIIRHKSRHALFRCGVRSRCRAGDNHAAGTGQAFHVAASDQ